MTRKAETFKVVDVAGSPRAMGRQYGEAAREGIAHHAALWGIRDAAAAEAFEAQAVEAWERYMPDVLEEARGIAEGANVPLHAILAMSQDNTYGSRVPATGCTSMVLADSPEGPLLGKNNDLGKHTRVQVIRRSKPDEGLTIVQAGDAGWLCGFDAINSAGLAIGHNSVGSQFDKRGRRVDIRAWTYRLLRRCRTTAEFLAGLAEAPLTGKGFAMAVVDAAGDTCIVDAAVPLIATRDRGKPFVFATNHYMSPHLRDVDNRTPEAKEITQYRYGYLRWVERTCPPRSMADLARILSSHEPWAPCRHGGAHCSSTAWSIIGQPRTRQLHVASGHPCEYAYVAFDAA